VEVVEILMVAMETLLLPVLEVLVEAVTVDLETNLMILPLLLEIMVQLTRVVVAVEAHTIKTLLLEVI